MWIGDFVRCHSVVKVLKARFPSRPVDVLSTTLCAPLADYMPELRQAVVVDLPRKRLAYAQHAALAQRLKRENYGTALIMPRTWKAALAPFLAGIPERVGWLGEMRFLLLNDLRFGERKRPRMIDQCAALALPAGADPPGQLAVARAAGYLRPRSPAGASGSALPRAGRRSRSRPARSGRRNAGRLRLRGGRAAPDRAGHRRLGPRRTGREAARHADHRGCRPARPRSDRHRPARRDPGAGGGGRRGLERLRAAACRGRARHAGGRHIRPHQPVALGTVESDRRGRAGAGASSTASRATSRPAGCSITAACATSRPNRCSK